MYRICRYLWVALLLVFYLAACTSVQPSSGSTPQATPSITSNNSNTPSGTPSPTTEQATQLEQQLFALINKDRAAQAGLYPYTFDATLATGARAHSVKMAACGLTHACPNEPDPCQRVSNEGVTWTSCGENVGYTSPYPTAWEAVEKIEQAMLDEPPPAGHRMN